MVNGDLMVSGENSTANIIASYPAKHLPTLNGFVDQVQRRLFLRAVSCRAHWLTERVCIDLEYHFFM